MAFDGPEDIALVCDSCVQADDATRRQRMRERAAWLKESAGDLLAWASGAIQSVAADVLELERMYHQDATIFEDAR